VDNGAELALGLGQVDTHNMVLTDGGVLNVASRDYVLNSDLNNARYITNDKSAPITTTVLLPLTPTAIWR
jgi:hypothetical protein